MSRLLKGPEGAHAREVLKHAPPDIRHEVQLLAGVATRIRPGEAQQGEAEEAKNEDQKKEIEVLTAEIGKNNLFYYPF